MTLQDILPKGPAAVGAYKVRLRIRRLASPPEGHRQEWDEVQVTWGKRVVARFDFFHQAQSWVDNRIKGDK